MKRLLLTLSIVVFSVTLFAMPLPAKKFNPVWYYTTSSTHFVMEDEHHICSETTTNTYAVDWMNQSTLVGSSTVTNYCHYY